MKDLDFRKQLIINEFKTMSKGKSKEEILPLLLALSTKAKQAGINFTKEDTLLIIEQVKTNSQNRNDKCFLRFLLL